MLIRVGYDIEFFLPCEVAMLAMLNVHPSRSLDLLEPDEVRTEPEILVSNYFDSFGNRCTRFVAPAGRLRLTGSTLVLDSGKPDPVKLSARECPVGDLPEDVLMYLLNSRYCEVDRLSTTAFELFGQTQPGWPRVQAVCDWVHAKVRFDYAAARPTKTALETFHERRGVCRDMAHLAVAFCRCLNIPARYCTTYLGDIRVPPVDAPMDFAGCMEVFLGGAWHVFDPRNNARRIGRIIIARGRDAADVAISMTFGPNVLESFRVWADEVTAA